MPLTPSFSVSQIFGAQNTVVLTDTSTGSDGSVTTRRAYISTSAGVFLTPANTPTDYTEWDYASPDIEIQCLDKDYAVLIRVQWVDVSGNILYTYTIGSVGLTLYNETYDYQLSQRLTGNPLLINDAAFFENKSKLRVCIDSGNQLISLISDNYAAQQCYDRGTDLRVDGVYNFNANA